MQKLKSEKGFTTIDTSISIVIVLISLVLIANIIYNMYIQVLSTHKNDMATFYAVEILEKINKLDYNDIYLEQGLKTSENNKIIDIPIEENYIVNLKIEDYNKLQGNENKEDIIKLIEVNIKFRDNNIDKNVNMKTLKYNM